jgi:hypothetical protein
MDAKGSKWAQRVLLVIAALTISAVMAMPATAVAAKAATRIVVASRTILDHDTPGSTPWPFSLRARLQKKSGTRYVSLSGAVKLYRYNWVTELWDYQTSVRSSSPAFTLTRHGAYKLVYAGSSTTKAATGYTTIYETIGETVTEPVISIDPIAGTTQYSVSVTCTVDWNTEAWGGFLQLRYRGSLEDGTDADGAWIDVSRQIWAPGTVAFSYKVDAVDLRDYLKAKVGMWGYWRTYSYPYLWLDNDVEYTFTTSDLMP